jgi:shikimate dehydrogenase
LIRVDGTTQVYAVLGQPVHHSRSPEIQNAAFRAAGMNAVYVALEVPAPRLKQALDGLHAARVLGLNLTAPHKESAFALARECTPEGNDARAVNTLRWEPGGWRGHATDGVGFLAWVSEVGDDLSGKRILLLGAGGAVRSIITPLITLRPESIHVVSRRADRAGSLARGTAGSLARGTEEYQIPVTSAALVDTGGGGSNVEGKGWHVIIRALSVEAVSDEEERWWRGHEKGALVFDLNYGSRATDARAHARAHGLRYEDGGALLIHQGAASFEFWTGRKADRDAMREALRAAG